MANSEEIVAFNLQPKPERIRIERSTKEDVLSGVYAIDIQQPVAILDNDFCKYYTAINKNDNSQYFAIVFEKHYTPNIQLLEVLRNNPIPVLNNLLAYGIVRLSELHEWRMVAIVPKYNHDSTLQTHLSSKGPLSSKEVEEEFIPQLIKLFAKCEELKISCGNIHPANILISADGSIHLREFFISYPGFGQEAYYLAPEISECTPYARVVNTVAADIYAFGLVTLEAVTGKKPWMQYESVNAFNHDRFDHGSFKLMASRRKLSEHFKVFFKYTLHDNPSLRWMAASIEDWKLGEYNASLVVDQIMDQALNNINGLLFNQTTHSSLKSLAYEFFCNWDEALQFIREEKLLKWVQRQQISQDIVDEVTEILKPYLSGVSVRFSVAERDNKMVRLLSAIDPQGPVRKSGLGISASSIPQAIQYLASTGKTALIEAIIGLFQGKEWLSASAKSLSSARYIDQDNMKLCDDAFANFSASSAYHGIDTLVYTLNPYTICLSPLLSAEYITNLKELLVVLEHIATEAPDKLTLDRHIISFICAKLGVRKDSPFRLLKNFPKLSDHPLVYGLGILSAAGQHEPDLKLPNLCKVLSQKIITLFEDNLHNIAFKQHLSEKLVKLSEAGELQGLLSVFSDQNSFIADYHGYNNALKEVHNIRAYVANLQGQGGDSENALAIGQKVTVLVSYLLCLIVTLLLMV